MRQFTFSKLLIAFLMMLYCGTAMASDFVTVDGFKFLVDTDKDEATLLPNDYSGEVVIPEYVVFEGKEFPVVTLGPHCFSWRVTKVAIPNIVRTLSDGCFGGAEIESIQIPSSVTSFGEGCFRSSKLKNIEIPSSVIKLGNSCFAYCANLESVTLSKSLSVIPNQCFQKCQKLENIEIPSSIITIGSEAFEGCNLSEINFPESLISIFGFDAFSGNPFQKFVISATLQYVSKRMFGNCDQLKEIICFAKKPVRCGSYSEGIFEDFNQLESTLYVPQESLELYKKDWEWGKFGVIKAIEGENEESKACVAPTIIYTSGNLSFECSTPGAEYHYTVKDADVATDKYNTDGKVQLNGKLDISVYATADGYKASDKATATLYWLNAEGGDDTNNINLVKTRGVMVTTDSDITISGLNDGEVVTFYSVNGVNLGSAKAVQGVLHFAKPNESIVIAKIKGNDLKIAIK